MTSSRRSLYVEVGRRGSSSKIVLRLEAKGLNLLYMRELEIVLTETTHVTMHYRCTCAVCARPGRRVTNQRSSHSRSWSTPWSFMRIPICIWIYSIAVPASLHSKLTTIQIYICRVTAPSVVRAMHFILQAIDHNIASSKNETWNRTGYYKQSPSTSQIQHYHYARCWAHVASLQFESGKRKQLTVYMWSSDQPWTIGE